MNGGTFKHKKIDLSAFAAASSVFSVSQGESSQATPRKPVPVTYGCTGTSVSDNLLQTFNAHHKDSPSSSLKSTTIRDSNRNEASSVDLSDESNFIPEKDEKSNTKPKIKNQSQHTYLDEKETSMASSNTTSSRTTTEKYFSKQNAKSVQGVDYPNVSSHTDTRMRHSSVLLPVANIVEIGSLFRSMKLLPTWYRVFSLTAPLGLLLLDVSGAFGPNKSRKQSAGINVTSHGEEEATNPSQSYFLLLYLIVDSMLQQFHLSFGTNFMWPGGYKIVLQMMSLQDRFICAFVSILLGLSALKSYHLQKWVCVQIEELTGLRVSNSVVDDALYKVIEEMGKSSQDSQWQLEAQKPINRALLKNQVKDYLHLSLSRAIEKSLRKEKLSFLAKKGKITSSTVGMLRSCSYLGPPPHDAQLGNTETKEDTYFDIDNPESMKEGKFHSGMVAAFFLVICLIMESVWIARSNLHETFFRYDSSVPFSESVASKHPHMFPILLYSPHLVYQLQSIMTFITEYWLHHVGSILFITVVYRYFSDVLGYLRKRHSSTAVSFRCFILTALCLKVVYNLINLIMRIQGGYSDDPNYLFPISLVAALIAITITNYVYHRSGKEDGNNNDGNDALEDVKIGRFSQIISISLRGHSDNRYNINTDASVYEIGFLMKQYLSEHIRVNEAPLTKTTGLKILLLNGFRCALISIQGITTILAMITGVHVVELFLLWLLTGLVLLWIPSAIDAFSVEFFLLFSVVVGFGAGLLLPSEFVSLTQKESAEGSAMLFSGAVALLIFSSLLAISCVYNVGTLLVTLGVRQHHSINQLVPNFTQRVACYISSRRRVFGLALSSPLILYVIINALTLATNHFTETSPISPLRGIVEKQNKDTSIINIIPIIQEIGFIVINSVKFCFQIIANINSAVVAGANEYMSREHKSIIKRIWRATIVVILDLVNTTKELVGVGTVSSSSLDSLASGIYSLFSLIIADLLNLCHFFTPRGNSSTSKSTMVNFTSSILIHLLITTVGLEINKRLLHRVGPVKVYLLANSFATPVISQNRGSLRPVDGNPYTFTHSKTDGFVIALLDIFIKKLANGVALFVVVGGSFTVSVALAQYFLDGPVDTSLQQSHVVGNDRFINIIVALSPSVPLQIIIFIIAFCASIGASKGILHVLNSHVIRAITHRYCPSKIQGSQKTR